MSEKCRYCGAELEENVLLCPKCGKWIFDETELETDISGPNFDGETPAPENYISDSGSSELQSLADQLDRELGLNDTELSPKSSDDIESSSLNEEDIVPENVNIQPEDNSESSEVTPAAEVKEKNTGSDKKKSSAKASNGKKKKKKKGNGAIIGVIIGLLIAFLIVLAAAIYLLYSLGFFDQISDEDLLKTNEVVTTTSPTPPPEEIQAVIPTAEVSEEPEETEEPEPEATEEPEVPEPDRFEITGDTAFTFYTRGEALQIEYIVEPEELASQVVWETSDETIASVDDTGTVIARRGGSCTIYGACGSSWVQFDVTCSFNVPSTIMDMNYEDVTLSYEGETLQLQVDYDGLTDSQKESLVWESSDEAVATVSSTGLVTARGNGTAIITANLWDYTASCIIRCANVEGNKGVNSKESPYTINYEDVTLTRKGEYFQLKITAVDGGEVPEFTWATSDPSICTIDSDGIVTAAGNGTGKITATVNGDDFECVVRVKFS